MVSEFQIADYLRGLDAKTARVKYGSSKALRLASREAPPLVYPYFERFVSMMEGDNTILRWNAIWTVGYLAAADSEGRIESILRRFCAAIEGPEMIGAANTMGAAAEIALAQPHLAERLAGEILKVEHATYATSECRNVAIGHAIRSLQRIRPLLKPSPSVLEFVRRQLDNPRPATRRKAEIFLKSNRKEATSRCGAS